MTNKKKPDPEDLKAIAINTKGQVIRFHHFDYHHTAHCANRELVKLEVMEGIVNVYCFNNPLKELILPATVNYMKCDKETIDYDTCEIQNVDVLYFYHQYNLIRYE